MTWRRNNSEEIAELRQFVEEMKRGVTPPTGDSLLETLRQIHDRREAPSTDAGHRNMLLERLRREMAARDGEPRVDGGREPISLPVARPRLVLRWALGASLVAHAAAALVVLPYVNFNPSLVANALYPHDERAAYSGSDVIFLPPVPKDDAGPGQTGRVGAPRGAAAGTAEFVTTPAGSTAKAATRSAAPVGPARPPVPSALGPMATAMVGNTTDFAEGTFAGPTDHDLSGPPAPDEPPPPQPFTEVMAYGESRDIDTQPRITFSPKPVYSADALEDNVQGVVFVAAVLGADGVVRDAHVVRSIGHGLDEAAIRAVRLIRFVPATRNGVPVSVPQTIKVVFSLR